MAFEGLNVMRSQNLCLIEKYLKKIEVLKLPKRSAIKPVLIYLGELDPNHENEIENYFYKVIPFDTFFKV